MAGDHQVGVIANSGAPALLYRQPAGIHLEGSAQIGLADKIKVDSVERRGCLHRCVGLRIGDAPGSQRQKHSGKPKAYDAPCRRCSIHWKTLFIRRFERRYTALLIAIFLGLD
jgi:hypothetical protein